MISVDPGSPVMTVPKIVESVTWTKPECQADMEYNNDVTFRWLLKRPNGTEQVLRDRYTPDVIR